MTDIGTVAKAIYAQQLRSMRERVIDYERMNIDWAIIDGLVDDDIIYIHEDYSVTKGITKGVDEIVSEGSAQWVSYCHEKLKFNPDTY